MSNSTLNRIWDIGTSCSSLSHLAVLIAIGDACNDDNYCWMSLETLERKVKKVKRRQLINLLHDLERAGDIAVIKTYVEDGRNTYNHYVATLGLSPVERERAVAAAIRHTFGRGQVRREGATECTPIGGEGVTECTPQGAVECTGRVQPTAPDPSYDPEEDIYTPARAGEPVLKPPRSAAPGPSLLERQGYSPEPPVTAAARGGPPLPDAAYLKRLPWTLERMGVSPAGMREMAGADGPLAVPGIYTGDRGRAFAHGPDYPMYLWMLNVLAMVCGENLTSGESTTLAEPLWRTAREWVNEGRTPPQVWARFGDPEGYWYASEDHGWKGKRPTVTDVGRKWTAAGGPWKKQGAARPAVAGAAPAPDEQIETAWENVARTISRYGRYRQTEIMEALDETTRAAVRAVGLSRLMDVEPQDRSGLRNIKRQFAGEYRDAARRAAPAAAD